MVENTGRKRDTKEAAAARKGNGTHNLHCDLRALQAKHARLVRFSFLSSDLPATTISSPSSVLLLAIFAPRVFLLIVSLRCERVESSRSVAPPPQKRPLFLRLGPRQLKASAMEGRLRDTKAVHQRECLQHSMCCILYFLRGRKTGLPEYRYK